MKSSPILIVKQLPLDGLTDPQRDVIRHALTVAVTGINKQHDKRWRRWINRLLRASVGEVFHFLNVTERSGPYHRMHMGFEDRLYEGQERWTNQKGMRDWLKVGAGWCTWEPGAHGGIVPIPVSIDYEHCSDDEMREVHEAMVAFMRTPHAQRRLWPHLTAPQRSEMFEAILAGDPEREQQGDSAPHHPGRTTGGRR